jgi:predicted NUDIX family NTP pyrophosphohydrolase
MGFKETYEDANAISSGIMLYHKENNSLKVFLVHLGGPKFSGKDAGFWGIPKGHTEAAESLEITARREFEEETGIKIPMQAKLMPLGTIKTGRGKTVHCFAVEGTGNEKFISSNECETEWPLKSGKMITVPENDKGEWFDISVAMRKINDRQSVFLNRLDTLLRD